MDYWLGNISVIPGHKLFCNFRTVWCFIGDEGDRWNQNLYGVYWYGHEASTRYTNVAIQSPIGLRVADDMDHDTRRMTIRNNSYTYAKPTKGSSI